MSGSYSLKGPAWSGTTVTYSFAVANLPSNGLLPYSRFITQPDVQAIIRSAMVRWEGVTGITFVQVPDGAGVDVRIGWGNLAVVGANTIGVTYYPLQASVTYLAPELVVELDDPATFGVGSGGGGSGSGNGPTGDMAPDIYGWFNAQTLYQVAAHELGHALGLNHSNDPTALMYPVATSANPDVAAPDAAGVQVMYGLPFAGVATVQASGGPVAMGFDEAGRAAVAQQLLDGRGGGVQADHVGGNGVMVPASPTMAIDAVGPVTMVGAGIAGQAVVAGRGGLDLFGLGSGTVMAGGGANLIGIPLLGGGNWDVLLGAGNDIVQAQAGNDTIAAGGGQNLVFLGTGASSVLAVGTDTIIGGSGASTVSAAAGAVIGFAGAGLFTFIGGSGVDTVIGNGGRVFVSGGAGGGVFTGGSSGVNAITGGSGAATIVGAGAGDVLYSGGAAGDLVAGGAGSGTVSAEASLGNDTLFAGAGNTLLRGGFGLDILVPGTGNDTIQPGPGAELVAFINGRSGGLDRVEGFIPGSTFVLLSGYGATAMADALAGATTAGGSTTLALADGTQVTFAGISGLTPANFL